MLEHSRRLWLSRQTTGIAALVLVLCVTVSALVLWLQDPTVLQGLRLAQFDQFQRWHPGRDTPSAVQVVDIDEASLKAYGQWPWPRDHLANLVEQLNAAGAAVIVFDVLLAEPDRTAPKAAAGLWQDSRTSALLQASPDPDKHLAGVLASSRVVLGSFLSNQITAAASTVNAADDSGKPYRVIVSGTGAAASWFGEFKTAIRPLPLLAASAQGEGAINMASDRDAVVRRVPLMLRQGAQWVPGLSAEAMRVFLRQRNYVLRSGPAGVQDLRIGSVSVPTNASAEMWLHYGAAGTVRSIPAAQVLAGKLASQQLQGAIVLVGTSAVGLFDLRFNALGQLMPGVQSHALALEQMLSGQYLERPAWSLGAEALVLLLGSLVVGLAALASPFWVSALLTLSLLSALAAGVWYAFALGHWLLDGINPALAMLLSFSLASGVHHWVSERQRSWVRDAFSRYVSPNRVAHLMAHPEQLQLSGKRQACGFVFTDVAGFTSLLESCDPAQVVTLLNDYLEGMLEIVFRHDGTLERIMGDAFAVLFSAPVVQSDYRQRALDCALEMDAFAWAYAQRIQATGIAWGHTRIGVHCGEVIVGNFGGKAMFDYRALGDPINTAARLESVNKYLGTRVCVSQAIVEGCSGVPVRVVGRLLLQGKTLALETYEPLITADPAGRAAAAEYDQAMRLLRSGQARAALTQFEALAQRAPTDPLVKLHLQRLRAGAQDDLIVMSTK